MPFGEQKLGEGVLPADPSNLDRNRALADAAWALGRSEGLEGVVGTLARLATELTGAPRATIHLDGYERTLGFSQSESCPELDSDAFAHPLRNRNGDSLGLIRLSPVPPGAIDSTRQMLDDLLSVAMIAIENAYLRLELQCAERGLVERTQELGAMMDAVPAVVWLAHDPEATIITGSRASYELLRLPYGVNASITGERPPSNFRVMKDGRELMPEELPVQLAAKTGADVTGFSEQVVFDDGEVRYLYGNATPLWATDGSVRGALAAFLDITDLFHAEERYRRLANNVPLIVWTTNASGVIDFVNEQWEAYFGPANGLSPAEQWRQTIHPDDAEAAMQGWQESWEARQPFTAEYRLKSPAGEYRWHLCLARPHSGSPTDRSFVGSFVDVHERKLQESALHFLMELSEATRQQTRPSDVMQTTARLVADYLQLHRVAYAEIDAAGDQFMVTGEYCRGETSILGWHSFANYGNGLRQMLEENQCVIVPDVRGISDSEMAERCGRVQIRSMVSVPLLKEGRLVAVLGAFHDEPRAWTEHEVQLLQIVTQRCWFAIDRTRSDQERVRSQMRYQALAEAAATVVFAADADGRLTEIPYLRGLPPSAKQSALGSGWIEVVHPDDRPRAWQVWREAVATRTPYQVQYRIRMADGDYRWHVARGVCLPAQDGFGTEWIGVCVDIHERITTERTLTLLDRLTEQTRDAVTEDEVVIAAQQLLGEALGVTRCAYGEPVQEGRQFVGPPNYCVGCEDLRGKYPLSGYDSAISRSMRAGETIVVGDVAAEISPEDGRDVYLENALAALVCVPVFASGRLVAMLGVHQDRPRVWSSDEVQLVKGIAERTWSELGRVRAQLAVQRSEQRLRITLHAATVGVVLNDATGRFLYANGPMLRILGYSEEDLVQKKLSWSVIQAPERKLADDRALEELRLRGTCEPYETEYVRADGSRVPVYVGAAFVPDGESDGDLGAAFVTDLTPLKEAERELVRLNAGLERRVEERTADLEAANRELEGFMHTVAHDLRAPLRAIIATSRLLKEDLPDLEPEPAALLDRQASSALHLARLLDDLLTNARIARQEVRRTEFDLSVMAQDIAENLLADHPHPIQIESGMWVQGDEELIRLTLQNLLDNACKFSPNGEPITVGRAKTDRGIAFFVRDRGVGFDMEHARNLFKPFVRLVRQDEFPGTGIGLANVKRVVERHGGQIWVESQPGQGTTFWWTLGESSP